MVGRNPSRKADGVPSGAPATDSLPSIIHILMVVGLGGGRTYPCWKGALVHRPNNLLSLALIVSALLFLTACPFKVGGAGSSDPSQGPDGEPIVHHFGGGGWVHHQKPVKFSLPKPPHASGSNRPLPGYFQDHPTAGTRRAAPW